MNKILIDNNKITSTDKTILIDNNTIKFTTSGDYEIEYINFILKEKISYLFEISSVNVLYDFLNKAAYIGVYDEKMNWFAIVHRDSGEIFERANRDFPYKKYLNNPH